MTDHARIVLSRSVLAVAAVLIAWQLFDAARYYLLWREWVNDPSGRDAYFTFMEVALGLATFIAIVAAIAWALIRPRRRADVT